MKDFGKWMEDAGKVEIEDALPDNIRSYPEKTGDDRYQARCCCCDRWGPLYVDITEIDISGDYEHYCGRSDRCIP